MIVWLKIYKLDTAFKIFTFAFSGKSDYLNSEVAKFGHFYSLSEKGASMQKVA